MSKIKCLGAKIKGIIALLITLIITLLSTNMSNSTYLAGKSLIPRSNILHIKYKQRISIDRGISTTQETVRMTDKSESLADSKNDRQVGITVHKLYKQSCIPHKYKPRFHRNPFHVFTNQDSTSFHVFSNLKIKNFFLFLPRFFLSLYN